MDQSKKIFRVLACGSNNKGQLGIGHKDDVNTLQQALLSNRTEPPDFTLEKRVVKVVAGGNHTLLLTDSGDLYRAGDDLPQFSYWDIGGTIRPAGLAPPYHVCLAAATVEASILVIGDTAGNTRVWSYGVGGKGELGHGEQNTAADSLLEVEGFPPRGTRIVDISASLYHVVAVLDNGEAWGWGAGRKGQLGGPPEATIWSPRRIPDVPFPVARAVCGQEFTCFFGGPKSGNICILGSDKDQIRSNAPAASILGVWKDVAAGWHNVYVLKPDGNILAWGKNNLRQLPPPNLTGVTRIAAGSGHAVALDNTGAVTAWGWGKHGECGPGPGGDGRGHASVIASTQQMRPDGSGIIGIGAGWATSWVIVESRLNPHLPG